MNYQSFEEVKNDTNLISIYEEYIYSSDLDILLNGESNYLDMRDALLKLDSNSVQIQGALDILDSYFEDQALTQFELEKEDLYHWLMVEFADYFNGDDGRINISATKDKYIQKALMVLNDPVAYDNVFLPQ